MLEFLEQHFGAAIHAAGSIYIVLGIVLMCFKVPGTPDYAPYRLSKKLLALSLWLTSANVYLWLFTFTGNWNANDPWVACFDIIFYYAISITLTFSFSNLLDRNYITKRRCITSLTKFGITTLIAISSQLEVLKEYQQWLLLIALLGLIEYFTKFMITSERLMLEAESYSTTIFRPTSATSSLGSSTVCLCSTCWVSSPS